MLDAPIVTFRGYENIQIHIQPTELSHTNDIVIHFRTAINDGVIFTTWNGHNDDYMKAYLQNGHVHVDTFIERSGSEVGYLLLTRLCGRITAVQSMCEIINSDFLKLMLLKIIVMQ